MTEPTRSPAPRRAALAPPARPPVADVVARARQLLALYPEPRSALIPLCHLAQEQDGWLTPEAMADIADLVGVTPAEVLGTATFYDMLHTEPVGRYVVAVCTNIACLLRGGRAARARRGLARHRTPGGTTADGDRHPGGRRVPGRLRPGAVRPGQPPLTSVPRPRRPSTG